MMVNKTYEVPAFMEPRSSCTDNISEHMNSDEMEKMMQGGALERLGEGGITGWQEQSVVLLEKVKNQQQCDYRGEESVKMRGRSVLGRKSASAQTRCGSEIVSQKLYDCKGVSKENGAKEEAEAYLGAVT